MDIGKKIWHPSRSRILNSNINAFKSWVGFDSFNWEEFHSWSITESDKFWNQLSQFVGIEWMSPPKGAYLEPSAERMLGAEWFSKGTLNYTQNLLHPHLGLSQQKTLPHEMSPAIISLKETGEVEELSWRELREKTFSLAQHLRLTGMQPGDVVCGVLCNNWQAIVALLAVAANGGVFSSCSPDFGASGISDRFGQMKPKILFYQGSYRYGGKEFSFAETLFELQQGVPSIQNFIEIQGLNQRQVFSQSFSFEELCSKSSLSKYHFVERSFSDPAFVLFSSGTTGKPKAIVHSVGGTLLQHKKELMLHSDIAAMDRLLFFTTCGWMMWNWMVSALACGATVLTYDGSPGYPSLKEFWKLLSINKVSAFGTSPKFLSSCEDEDLELRGVDLSSLKTVLTTGSPLLPRNFNWVYSQVKKDIHLSSISGGTDIIGCFMLGNPCRPVHVGEIQGPGLGMAIQAWDDRQKPVVGQKGELVCTKPFASMPVCFYGDDEKQSRFRKAYFEHYTSTQVWRHGDFIEWTKNGGVIVHGRSDATLNPGGVRIGTAEIYRNVEALDFVADSIAVGVPKKGDVFVILFIETRDQVILDSEMIVSIKKSIRNELTPRHVPHKIIQVAEVPYTRSGKKVEIAVLDEILGRPSHNRSALKNPRALRQFSELSSKCLE